MIRDTVISKHWLIFIIWFFFFSFLLFRELDYTMCFHSFDSVLRSTQGLTRRVRFMLSAGIWFTLRNHSTRINRFCESSSFVAQPDVCVPACLCVCVPSLTHCPASLVCWCQSRWERHPSPDKPAAERCHNRLSLNVHTHTLLFNAQSFANTNPTSQHFPL